MDDWDGVGYSDPIPPGGEGFASHPKLVTALFADGSTAGDPDWATVIRASRQSRFETLGNMIEDLDVRGNRSGAELISYLDALQAKRERVALALADSARAAAGHPTGALGDLFEERRPELKAANIQAEVAIARGVALVDTYRRMKEELGPNARPLWSDLPEPERIQHILVQLRTIRAMLIVAQPELGRQLR